MTSSDAGGPHVSQGAAGSECPDWPDGAGRPHVRLFTEMYTDSDL